MHDDPPCVPGDLVRCLAAIPGRLTLDRPYRLLALEPAQATATVRADDGQPCDAPLASLRLSVPASPAPGLYRHYRGGLYTLLCVARHSETEEWLVAYTSHATGDHWVRPLAMWSETVDGRPRFEAVGSKAGLSLRPHSNGPKEAIGTLNGLRPDPPKA